MNRSPASTTPGRTPSTALGNLADAAENVLDRIDDVVPLAETLDRIALHTRLRAVRKIHTRFARARVQARKQIKTLPYYAIAVRPEVLRAWAAAAEGLAHTHRLVQPDAELGPDGFTYPEGFLNESRLLRAIAEVEQVRAEWEPGKDLRDRATAAPEIESIAAALLDDLCSPFLSHPETRARFEQLRICLRPVLGGAVGVLPLLT
ncbi:hypothetical protein [Amycolatopsis anabasis]|uniref:hypothetical protein n=1 Tax=Amycolatopsis anabasis TaxID=1840409 RepID=UPI00131A9EF1|nr:hypothetical protein [Amycolatopsis anabasis]